MSFYSIWYFFLQEHLTLPIFHLHTLCPKVMQSPFYKVEMSGLHMIVTWLILQHLQTSLPRAKYFRLTWTIFVIYAIVLHR